MQKVMVLYLDESQQSANLQWEGGQGMIASGAAVV
jgi:hypothetical protein